MRLRNVFLVGLVVGVGYIPNLAAGQSAVVTPVADKTVTTAATLIQASNAFREALSCTNHDGTINVRWGDATITTTKGQRIPAGATAEIRTKSQVYMIAESGSVTVSCTEETK